MKFKIVTAVAAAMLLAACSSTPETSSATDGSGSTGTSTTSSASTSTVTPGTLQDFTQNVGDRVFFSFDRYDLTPEAQATLQKQAAWLKAYPQVTVVVEGHADERGTREYNLALGDRRATTVLNYLVALGIDKSRLSEVSYGKEKPVCVEANDSCWSQNRRGVTTLGN
jgi:peptidoglycan-associated lipoprotein